MADEIHLTDADRLPWLETVEADEPARGSAGRTIVLVLLILLLLAAVIWAVFRVGHHDAAADSSGGVIAAQEGDYKIKPDDPGGLKVAGEGDSAIATSTGVGSGAGRIDARQVPERPIAASHPQVIATSVPVHAAKSVTAAVPAHGGKLVAAAPVAAPREQVPGATSGGSIVQLGAFPTEAKANAAWSALAKRFSYIAALGKLVQPAEVNGRQVFRLRVNAGSAGAASDLCGKLKVAGEGCFITAG